MNEKQERIIMLGIGGFLLVMFLGALFGGMIAKRDGKKPNNECLEFGYDYILWSNNTGEDLFCCDDIGNCYNMTEKQKLIQEELFNKALPLKDYYKKP